MTLYQRIDILLILRDSSVSDMLTSCGITRQAYSNWRTGKRNPRQKNLQKIADYLGKSVEDLASNTELVPESAKEKTLLQIFKTASKEQQDQIIIASLDIVS